MSEIKSDEKDLSASGASPSEFTASLIDGEFLRNPYPIYEQLQSQFPVLWYEPSQLWYVSRYQDVVALLLHKGCSSDRVKIFNRRLAATQQEIFAPLLASLSRWVVFQDPPVHTRIRKVINQAFSMQVVNGLASKIQQVARELVAESASSDGWDVVAKVAYPLPVIIIAEMLGVPVEDRDMLKGWSDDIANFFGRIASDPALIVKANASIAEANLYFGEIIKQQQKAPKDNLIQVLIDFSRQNDDFSHDDLLANCMSIIFAGHETTTNLISTGLLTLLKHPDQLEMLRHDRELMAPCIEECLRFEAPVQRLGRMLTEDIEVAGTLIPKGAGVLLLVGASGRDPAVFKNPHAFDIKREWNRHLAFGWGLHNCSGAHLARLEASAAFNAILDQFPSLALQHGPVLWHENLSLRGLKSLRVS